jgi:hypothetical protein
VVKQPPSLVRATALFLRFSALPTLGVSAILPSLACSGSVGSAAAAAAKAPPSPPVAPAPPAKDDGRPAKGTVGGSAHAAALEQLRIAPLGGGVDKQNSVRIQLPDARHWTRVKFWGVPSLVGFRYGKEHHAIVAAFVTHVDDNTAIGACQKSFEELALPYMSSFEVDVEYEQPQATVWRGKITDIASVYAHTATLASRDEFAGAFASYPAWPGACLIVGVAVPVNGDVRRARDVRDRFVREVLPHVEVLANEEPKQRY